jgi:uncharacterized protein YoxC
MSLFYNLNEILKNNIVMALFGSLASIVALTIILTQEISKYSSNAVKEELSNNISIVQTDVKKYKKEFEQTLASAYELQNKINQISNTVKTLTTEEINSRLNDVDLKIETLSQQISGLQQIISPKNASEILNVARMSQEILDREKLEKRIDESIKSSETKLDGMEGKLNKLQYWIWGSLVTLICGLFGAVAYLGKSMTSAIIQSKNDNSSPG